jgi:hypothetical protein
VNAVILIKRNVLQAFGVLNDLNALALALVRAGHRVIFLQNEF